MAIRPVYTGVEAIMSAVETFLEEVPYVSLWNGKILLAQFKDKNTAVDSLTSILDNAVETGNTDVFLLKFHPELTNGWITDKTPVVTTLPVQALMRSVNNVGGMQTSLSQSQYKSAIVGQIGELLLPISERLTALEKPQVDEQDVIDKWLDRLNHPAVGSLISMLLPKLIPGLNAVNAMQNLQVSGVPGQVEEWNEGLSDVEIEIVNDSLDHLKANGMSFPSDLTKLVVMSVNNKTLFDMLLGQLRSQQ